MFRTASAEGSGPRTPPAYAPHPPYVPPRFFPPRIRPPPPQYCFDAARFACDASKPRYLDVERERLVTRWLAEANEALVRRDRPPRYKPRSSERRPDFPERRPNAPEWADNFLLGRRNGSVEPPEDDSSEVMTLKEFVDKFSLPRVVKFEGEERPVLLYRVLEAHRRVEAVPLSGKKGKLVGKPLYIPDSYDGWFSACGCRGGALASARGSIAALLRARAFALVSPRAISAYRARPTSDSGRVGAQYERAAARPGTPLRLAGVFADGSKAKAPKYAQLIDPQGNGVNLTLFVDLLDSAMETSGAERFKELVHDNNISHTMAEPDLEQLDLNAFNWLLEAKIYNKDFNEVPGKWIIENADVIVLIFTILGAEKDGILNDFNTIYEKAKYVNVPIEVIYIPMDDTEQDAKNCFNSMANWFYMKFDDPLVIILMYMFEVTCVPQMRVLSGNGSMVSRTGLADIEKHGMNAIICWLSTPATTKQHRNFDREQEIYGQDWFYLKKNRLERAMERSIQSNRQTAIECGILRWVKTGIADVELFVPINTKGEMYEVCPEELSPAEWDGEGVGGGAAPPPDVAARAHRLPHLLSLWRLPTRVRLLAGTVPIEMAHDVGDDLLLRASVTEAVLVMCTLPEYGATPSSPKQVDPRYYAKEALQLLSLNSPLKIRRTQLGFESEKRMFLSARLQKALTFCQLNVDNWIRQISYANSTVASKAKTAEDLIREDHMPVKFEKERKFTLQGLKIDTSRLFGKSEKVLKDIPDETEGSIIFLSKNELEHMNYDVYSDDDVKDDKSENKTEPEQFSNEKMHVFREDSGQKKNKWFKNLKLLKSTEKLTDEKITAIENSERHKVDVKDPFDPLGEKHCSIERYQDMAKLIEDRFGGIKKNDGTTEKSHSYKSLTTSSSDMGTSQCSSNPKKPVLTKSVSVQTGMPDSPYTEGSGVNMIHGRKNLSVDQINYCGSMESDSSSGRKLKSLDENMLKKTSATKSSSNLERRQRIQPDLIPEKAMVKAESYNQIQSCEEINMFGVGSLYNDSDFEINYKQHSYITEKLCSEFHVKTKRVLSKSTSNLLHPKKPSDKKEGSNSNSMPTKTERDNDEKFNFRKKIDKPRAPTPKSDVDEDEITSIDISEEEPSQMKVKRSISSIQKRKLPVIEDLPYGQVADAVAVQEEKADSDASSDNIYAEICTPGNKTSDEENYDSSVDVLATDPVICNVKKEVIIRNDERARQMIENQENPFRHIEVVVIEKTTDFDLDTSSITSSDIDDLGSKNDISIAIDSWERDKSITHETDQKIHAIRLEITSNMDDYPVESNSQSLERNNVQLSKDNDVSFSNSIHLNGTYPNEAIYDTLK